MLVRRIRYACSVLFMLYATQSLWAASVASGLQVTTKPELLYFKRLNYDQKHHYLAQLMQGTGRFRFENNQPVVRVYRLIDLLRSGVLPAYFRHYATEDTLLHYIAWYASEDFLKTLRAGLLSESKIYFKPHYFDAANRSGHKPTDYFSTRDTPTGMTVSKRAIIDGMYIDGIMRTACCCCLVL